MEREPARRFQDLVVWQKAHAMVLAVYRCSAAFPKSELYGLTSQIRRAAVSVPANIAEGFKRQHRPEKIRFLNVAQGSLEETRYFLILAADLAYGDTRGLARQLEEVSRLLGTYVQRIHASLRRKPDDPPHF